MNFEDFNLSLRPRRTWEAADLGISLVRQNWQTVYAFWGLWCMSLLSLFYWLFDSLTVAGIFFWLFLPWGERALLWVFSRSVFAQKATFKECLKEFPKLITKGFWPFLFYLRFLPWRSYLTAVWVLEGQKGNAASKRAAVLQPGDMNGPCGYGIIWAHLEGVFYLGSIAIVWQLIPESLILHWVENFVDEQKFPEMIEVISYWLSGICLTIMRPVYCAGGFALYLHKRMQMEGWDIELQFRRIANRIGRMAGLAIIFFSCFFLTPEVHAEESIQNPQTMIEEVMQEPELSREKEVEKMFRWNFDWDKEKEVKKETSDFPFMGILLQIIKVLLVLALIAFFIYLLKILIDNGSKVRKVKKVKPDSDFLAVTKVGQFDLRREELPDDVFLAINKLLENGNNREATALLYRCFLARVVHVYQGVLRTSYTEKECLEASRILPEKEFSYFEDVTNTWMTTAYAHIIPSKQDLLQLARKWQTMELKCHAE